MTAFRQVKTLFLAGMYLLATTYTIAHGYQLSTSGQADIGAYHVQPGRCENVERTLRRRYYYFFRQSITQMSTPQLDSTALCADDPQLTQGYSGDFQDKPYLVYARCLYGKNTIRALCGTTDQSGKPTQIINPIQAACPKYTRCKNLCASKAHDVHSSPYSPAQVQLAQCMPFDQWNKVTQMYAPRSGPETHLGVSFTTEVSDDVEMDNLDPTIAHGLTTSDQSAAGYGNAAVSKFRGQKSLSAIGFRRRSLPNSSNSERRHASSTAHQ